MKLFQLTLIFLIGIVSCNISQTTKIERESQPDIYGVSSTDAEINKSIETANNNGSEAI